MRLNSIRLQNFRCFEDLIIPLHERLNVFVGNNGSGKTTLLDAIGIALAPILTRFPFESRKALPKLAATDLRVEMSDIVSPFSRIEANAKVDDACDVVWDRTRFRDNTRLTQEELDGKANNTRDLYDFVDAIIERHNKNTSYELPVFAYYGTARAADVPRNRVNPPESSKYFRRLAGLENALGSKSDIRRAVGWFDILEQRELRDERDEGQATATSLLAPVRKAIENIIPGVSKPRIKGAGKFSVDLLDPNGTPITLTIDQLSDGYQAMLALVMDFALRLALANPPQHPQNKVLETEAMMMVDEIDLHLHPSWQQRVIPDLQRIFPQTQIIVTTHSPQVATTVPAESLRVFSQGKIHSVPAGTAGAQSQRLLEDVFGVKSRPPVEMAQKLQKYMQLVNDRRWESSEAIQLRTELDQWSQGEEPELLEADLQIENFQWEAGQ